MQNNNKEIEKVDSNKEPIKVLHVLDDLLFLAKSAIGMDSAAKKPLKTKDDIKNRVLLKIERAEIMSAMVAMREGKDIEKL